MEKREWEEIERGLEDKNSVINWIERLLEDREGFERVNNCEDFIREMKRGLKGENKGENKGEVGQKILREMRVVYEGVVHVNRKRSRAG